MEERKYGIKVDTRMTVTVVEKEKGQSMLDFCYKHCECDMIEAVNPRGLEYPYMFVCDEEYLFKDRPMLNHIASYLYETQDHGHPICGNVVVLRQGRSDFQLMTKDEAETMAKKLREMSVPALMEVSSKMREVVSQNV